MNFAALPSYLEWANTRALHMLRETDSAQGIQIFAHLLATELVWAARITQDTPPFPAWPAWTLEECAKAIPRSVGCWQALTDSLDTAKLISYHNSHGEAFISPTSDILLHVFAHGAYHRGQISQIVRAAGGEILDTDFIFFLRQ